MFLLVMRLFMVTGLNVSVLRMRSCASFGAFGTKVSIDTRGQSLGIPEGKPLASISDKSLSEGLPKSLLMGSIGCSLVAVLNSG